MPAGDRYVEIPAETFFAFLEGKGFFRETGRSRREVVYGRAHARDPRYRVLVYTSVAAGNARARKLGADAIRVVAIFDSPGPWGAARGVFKGKRVFRTGTVDGVLLRVLERAREAYGVCNERVKEARRRGGGVNPG